MDIFKFLFNCQNGSKNLAMKNSSIYGMFRFKQFEKDEAESI
jgi:hypothetical protein